MRNAVPARGAAARWELPRRDLAPGLHALFPHGADPGRNEGGSVKKRLVTIFAVLAALGAGQGRLQAADAHRAVFELTSGDVEVWTGVLNNAENLRKALGASTVVEVVAHGKGLGMVTTTKSGPVRERMQQLADAGVVFAACENTMQREGVTRADLLPFATTVDSGVAEVVRKQADGWSYVRVG